jgi:formylglycine-generating enzyme required for sulfatase activity
LPVTDGGADSDSGVPISDGGATDGDSGSHGDGAPADGGDADSDDSGVDSGGVCADAGTRCLSGRISAFDPSWFERIEIGLLQIDDRLNVRIDDEHVIHDDTRSGAKGSFAMLASGRLLDDTGSVRRYEIALPRGDSLVPTSDGKYEYALLAWIDDDGDGEWDGIDSRETAGVSGSEVNGLPRSWFDAWQQTREHMTIYRFRTFASSIVNDPDNPWLMNIASPYTRRSGSSFSVRAEARIIDFRFLRADYGDALPLPSEPNTPGPSDETCTPLGSTSMCTVDLPGGTLQMGRRDGYPNDRPVHSVTIAPFTISKSEITVDQYQQCVDAGACTAATHWREDCNAELAEGAGDHPINCTTWYMAQDFATWIGGRLPTEAEWEWAASGAGAGTAYPWGNEPPDCTRVHMRVGVLADKGCGDNMTAPVCSLPAGHSPQGLCDLAGNVGEWVADDWHSDYERAPTDGSAWLGGGTVHKVRRGGTLDFESHFCAACRDQALPSAVHEDMGFRVVF